MHHPQLHQQQAFGSQHTARNKMKNKNERVGGGGGCQQLNNDTPTTAHETRAWNNDRYATRSSPSLLAGSAYIGVCLTHVE
jgi:hypothetical protein